MRAQWYGDRRDLVKWGVLLTVARQYGIERILQVAYLRPTMWGALEVGGRELPVPNEVIEHFRSPDRVAVLTHAPRIDVLADTFSDRSEYQQAVLRAIKGVSESERQMVFLDPDTGLAAKTPKLEHVLDQELVGIWQTLHQGDVLAVYQHQTNRNGAPWLDDKRAQLASALGLVPANIGVGLGTAIARDVAILYCRKDAGVDCDDQA